MVVRDPVGGLAVRHRFARAGRVLTPWAACGLALAGALPAGGAGQFQINTYTTGAQGAASAASAVDGDFVVVWSSPGSFGTDTSGTSIQGQLYASDGSAVGGEFQVNTYTASNQLSPEVAMSADGDFFVVWESSGSPGGDISNLSIQGQRYASDGSAQGAQFQINTYTTNIQNSPSVAASPAGDFVVVWHSFGSLGTDTSSGSIQGQRYASDGSPLAGEFQVNTYTTDSQLQPTVAVAADGDFVVTWGSYRSSGTDPLSLSVQGQRYASDGSAQGAQFQVNTYTTNAQRSPFVAAAADGGFVVTWRSYGSYGTDTSNYSIQGQRYASDGSAAGGEFQVNSYTTGSQGNHSVAAWPNGDFVVTWGSDGSAGGDTSASSVQGQLYASDGSALDVQFQVNSYTTNAQFAPSVVVSPGDEFVVTWQSDGSLGTDTSGASIQGQRYAVMLSVPSLSPAATAAGALLTLLAVALAARRRV
jgi:hypothetical protein